MRRKLRLKRKIKIIKKEKKEEKSDLIYINSFLSQYSFFFCIISFFISHRTTHKSIIKDLYFWASL